MLMLLFRVGDEPWAIAVSKIREIVPLVALQKMPHSLSEQASVVSGLMTYRGGSLPVVDVSALMSDRASTQTLNTRIAVVESAAKTTDDKQPQSTRLPAGLILDQVSGTAPLEPVANIPTVSPYVQANWRVASEAEVIRQLAIDPIIVQVHQKPLESEFNMTPNRSSNTSLEAVAMTNGFSQIGA